jgi:hypothetical protein
MWMKVKGSEALGPEPFIWSAMLVYFVMPYLVL